MKMLTKTSKILEISVFWIFWKNIFDPIFFVTSKSILLDEKVILDTVLAI